MDRVVPAAEQLGRFRADRAVPAAGAVEATTGVMDHNSREAEMARAMVRLSGSVPVLVDSSNFGKLAPFTVTGFDSIDCMVCDEAPDGQSAALMARERVEIIR